MVRFGSKSEANPGGFATRPGKRTPLRALRPLRTGFGQGL